MSDWRGKVIGFLLGLLTRRPQFMALGLLLGHLYDMGVFNRRASTEAPPGRSASDDAYSALGLLPGASDAEIEQAYRRLISEYHPDRVANAARGIREHAETRARELNVAVETLRRERRRDD